MSATGNFKHVSISLPATVLGEAYLTSATLTLKERNLIHSSVILNLGNLLGGPTTCTVRITTDPTGDFSVIPDTTSPISFGITDSTKGSCVFKTDIIVPTDSVTVYVWAFVDVGTAVLDAILLTGLE